MCRNIRPLFNYAPPATDEEVHAASLQFVRKISGFTRPSQANQEVFDRAVEEIARDVRRLIERLTTTASPRDRDTDAARVRERAARRFTRPGSAR